MCVCDYRRMLTDSPKSPAAMEAFQVQFKTSPTHWAPDGIPLPPSTITTLDRKAKASFRWRFNIATFVIVHVPVRWQHIHDTRVH